MLGQDMSAGLAALGASLGITQITPAFFSSALSTFVAADAEFLAQRSARQTASDGFTAADAELAAWLGNARLALATKLGQRWSTEWAQAGFRNNSTMVPTTISDRLVLTGVLVTFFSANPSYEQPTIEVTATQASTLHYAATIARAQFQAVDTAAGTAKEARAVAETALRQLMRALIAILTLKLGPDDARWDAFGLNRPGAQTTPGQPVGFTAVAGGNGTIAVGCDATPLATRYRFRIKVLGVDTAPRLGLSTPVPFGTIAKVEPGQTVETYVQAVNGQAQSVPSATVTVLVTASPAPQAAAPAVAEKSAPAETNGNGAGHGGNGHRTHATTVKNGR